MNVLDTFSGIGAFTQAALHIDAKVIAHVEKDKNCTKLLSKQHPDSIKLGDIQDVQKESIQAPINLIAGGSPCQNFSVAGNGEGLVGEESRLWFEYLRLVKTFKPEWLVWENVPGALYSNRGFDFLAILRGLDECGYHVAWRVFDAQYFGVPQRRRRVFIVGHLGDGRAAKVLFERESLYGTSKTRPTAWKASKVAGTLTASASGTARPSTQANALDYLVFQNKRSDEFQISDIASTLKARDKKDYGDLLTFTAASYKRDVEKNFISPSDVASTLRAKNNRGSSDTDELIVNLDGFSEKGFIRRFTPLECERLMGFPDNWTEGFSDSVRYGMLGNSIAVPVAKWIFEGIKSNE